MTSEKKRGTSPTGRTNYHLVSEAKKLNNFRIDPDRKVMDQVATRHGFVDVPMLVGETVNASFEFDFKGRAVGIANVSGPDAGKISFSMDGKKTQTLDLFTQWSRQLHLPWYLTFADELSPGKHSLKLNSIQDKNKKSIGNVCRVVYFFANE